MSKVQWSFSALKTFEQCPKKYYHLKVAQDVQDSAGSAAAYGLRFHQSAEDYGRDKKRLPIEFKGHKKLLDTLLAIPGENYYEMKLGLRKTDSGYEECDFDDETRWYRGIADLVIIDGKKGYSIDYKTGKSARYADIRQLDAVAAALCIKFPDLDVIKSALAYTECNDFIRKTHYRENLDSYLGRFNKPLDELESSFESGVWNAKTSPLCGWCPVVECEHHIER